MPAGPIAVVAAMVNHDNRAIEGIYDSAGGTDIGRHVLVVRLGADQRAVERVERNRDRLDAAELTLDRRNECLVVLDEIERQRFNEELAGCVALQNLLLISRLASVGAALPFE